GLAFILAGRHLARARGGSRLRHGIFGNLVRGHLSVAIVLVLRLRDGEQGQGRCAPEKFKGQSFHFPFNSCCFNCINRLRTASCSAFSPVGGVEASTAVASLLLLLPGMAST